MFIQGHRGSSENYPENTMLSFAKALEEGADFIELDVQKAGDSVFIVMHDTTLDRTTEGTGNIWANNSTYITSLDAGAWKGAEFANREDCRVPSLGQVLDAFKGKNQKIIIHAKIYAEADIRKFVDFVAAKNMMEQIHFFGSIDTINIIKQINSSYTTVNDGQPKIGSFDNYLQNAIMNGHEIVSISADDTEANMANMINRIKDAGKKVHVSYVEANYQEKLTFLKNAGADFVLVNNVASARTVIPTDTPIVRPNLVKLSSIISKTADGIIKTQYYQKQGSGLIKLSDLYQGTK